MYFIQLYINMKNYYEILEINENASYEIIEKSYKILSKKYNPDSWPSQQSFWAEDRLKEVTEAYQVLSNVKLRKDYDIKMGINNSYTEHPNKEEVDNMKKNNNSNENSNKESYFKRYTSTISSIIKEQSKESPEERSRDLKALILTAIIISILVFVFWKVPFLHNFIFP